jgi:magnesium-transporting ATPase (P-type)
MIHDICIGKTGTITEGKLTVKKFHLYDSHKVENNTEVAFFQNKLYI